MKIKFEHRLKRLIRENLLYILVFFSLNVISLFLSVDFVRQYQENRKKIDSIRNEIDKYNKEKEVLDFKDQVIQGEADLDNMNRVLTQLIPAKEDYFSIIASLENLSLQTNFIITSYNIAVDSSTPEKLSILIEGQGDPNDFLEFLKTYNIGGGRLITADKIQFSQETFTGARLNINVYSGAASTPQPLEAPSQVQVSMQLIETLMEKVQVELKSDESKLNEYPTKSNPF
ncbi:hypothetical protein HY612_02265 [Candidatus Roizmanbacteria bacterium]|nr:hypothetical protein [Candidatus Roizmanbacteria bacterium]